MRPTARGARRTTAVTIALAVAGAGGWWFTHQHANSAHAKRAATSDVVTVAARSGRLVESEKLSCSSVARTTRTVAIISSESKSVVTATPVKSGGQVSAGRAILEVSGRPVILFAGAIPPYRDISPKDTGPDVDQLGENLRDLGLLSSYSPTRGADDSFEKAVTALYKRLGYTRTSRSFPASEWVAITRLPAKLVLSGLTVGSSADDGSAHVESLARDLRCDVSAQQLKALRASKKVTGSDGRPLIVARSAAAKSTEGGAGFMAVLTPRSNASLPSAGTQQVTYQTSASSVAGIIVPLSALWTRGDGSDAVTVYLHAKRTSVAVKVLFTGSEEAVVKPTTATALASGDQVAVSSS